MTDGWPTTGSERAHWVPGIDRRMVSRRRWDAAVGPYDAAVTPMIADLDPVLPAALTDACARAERALRAFSTRTGAGGVDGRLPLAPVLLRTEASSSSQIERVRAGARAVAEADLGLRARGDAPLVVTNARAMVAAIERAARLDADDVIAVHAELLGGHAPALTGAFRADQVWIGGNTAGPRGADFVPPLARRVPAAVDDLLAFARRDDLPALAQAAIAHAQFETVHPFLDGNGRTGRALVHAMLRRRSVLGDATVPVSSGLLADVGGYVAALESYRRGDVVPIVTAFVRAVGFAVANARILVHDLAAIRDDIDERLVGVPRADDRERVAEMTLAQPVLDVRTVAERLGSDHERARAVLDDLAERGVVARARADRRTPVWVAQQVTTALDTFTERTAPRVGVARTAA